MTRKEILDTATSHVTKDRAATHGEAEDSFGLIGSLWGVYLNHPVSAYDVALMMALLKIARARMNPDHLDSVIDGAGYLACAGELASKNSAKPADDFIKDGEQPFGLQSEYERKLSELKSDPDFRDLAKDASVEELRISIESALRHARAKASPYGTIYDPSGSSDVSQG